MSDKKNRFFPYTGISSGGLTMEANPMNPYQNPQPRMLPLSNGPQPKMLPPYKGPQVYKPNPVSTRMGWRFQAPQPRMLPAAGGAGGAGLLGMSPGAAMSAAPLATTGALLAAAGGGYMAGRAIDNVSGKLDKNGRTISDKLGDKWGGRDNASIQAMLEENRRKYGPQNNGGLTAVAKPDPNSPMLNVGLPVTNGQEPLPKQYYAPIMDTNKPQAVQIPNSVVEQTGGVSRMVAQGAEVVKGKDGIFSTLNPNSYKKPGKNQAVAGLPMAGNAPTEAQIQEAVQMTPGEASRQRPNAASPANQGNRQGPMSLIYADRPMTEAEKAQLEEQGGWSGLRDRYNNTNNQQERAAVLREIWKMGGVPVIGYGNKRARAVDFMGQNVMQTRGIDTGIRPGSPEAEAHAAALAAHQSGDVYGGGDRQAHLQRNAAAARQGLLNTAAEKRALETEAAKVALEQAKKGGGLNFTPDQAIKKYEIDSNAAVKREDIAAEDRRAAATLQKEADASKRRMNISEVNGVWVNGEGSPLPVEIQDRQARTKNTFTAMEKSFGDPDMVRAWQNNSTKKDKNKVIPVYDRSSGLYSWMKKKDIPVTLMPDMKTPVVEPLDTYDPRGHNALMTWLNSSVEEA